MSLSGSNGDIMRSFANDIELVIVRQGRISAMRPQQAGVAGVIGGFFTVVRVAEINNFEPGQKRSRNGLKIKRFVSAFWRGFWPGPPAQ
jgi:hypothetical protein